MVRFGAALFAGALLSAVSGLAASGASAATCTFNNSRIEVAPVTSNVACADGVAGIYSANASGGVRYDFFDRTYTLSYKSDEAKGDGAVQVLDGLDYRNTSDTIWKIGNFAAFGSIVLGVKQANGYALFELAEAEGSWSIFKANGNGARTNDYSHWAVWYTEPATPESLAPIPLPASLVLLLLGVGSFGVAARRRTSR